MKTTLKRALAFLFAFVMVASLIPASILADESGETTVVDETLNVAAPADTPAEGGTGGGYTEAPAEEAPVEEPAEAPAEEAPAEAPVEEPAEAPAEEVPAEAPVEEPAVVEQKLVIEPITPVESPEAVTPGAGGIEAGAIVTRPTATPANGYKIIFNGNGGKIGSTGTYKPSTVYQTGQTVNISTALGIYKSRISRDRSADYSTIYTFKEWNTAKDGSGTSYTNNDSITIEDSDVTLYAQWNEKEAVYWLIKMGEGGDHINYNGKTAQSFKAYCQDNGIAWVGLYCPVEAVAKEGYTFLGWYYGDQRITKGKLINDTFRKVLPKLNQETTGSVLEARFTDKIVITYSDGVNGEAFEDQEYIVEKGEATPAFKGTPTREFCEFLGWSPEVAATATESVTYVAQWKSHIPPDPKYNTPDELFIIHCTSDEDHPDKVWNWFGTHVVDNKDKAYNTERQVWTATAKVKMSQFLYEYQKDTGRKHYCTDESGKTISEVNIPLIWDDEQELWVPDGGMTVINIWCYTAPAAPVASQINGNGIWVRDSDTTNKETAKGIKYTIKQLIAGTYEIGEMYKKEDGTFWSTLTITNLQPYVDAFNTKYGKADQAPYIIDTEKTTATFTFNLKYTGSTLEYKQDGTGWEVQHDTNKEQLNGKELWVFSRYVVTYTDGKNGKAFADDVHYVKAGEATPEFRLEDIPSWELVDWTPDVADTVTANATYTAVLWKKPNNSIQYNGNGGTRKNGDSVLTHYTEEASLRVDVNGAVVFQRKNCVFDGWNTEPDGSGTTYAQGDTVEFTAIHNGEVVVLYALWRANEPAEPNSNSNNTPEYMFTLHCTTDDDHADEAVDWQQALVTYNKDMEWNNVRRVWTASVKVKISGITSGYMNNTRTHHCDKDYVDIPLIWNPDEEVWMLDGMTVVNIWCHTAPAAPVASKLDSKVLTVKDTDAKANSTLYKGKNLIDGTYTFGEVTKDEEGTFWCTLTLTNLQPYVDAYNAKYNKDNSKLSYRIDTEETTATFTYTLKYTGSTVEYKQDGSGWTIQHKGTIATLNGKFLYVYSPVTITYVDGKKGTVFENNVHEAKKGSATPAFDGTVTPGWKITGWTPEVSETVTGDVTYTAVLEMGEKNILRLDGNGGTKSDGTTTTDKSTNSNYIKVPTDGSEFRNPGWRVKEWNTEPDGSGTTYKKNDQVDFEYAHNGEVVVLYAQWTQGPANTLYLHGNGGLRNGSQTYTTYTNADHYVMPNSSTGAYDFVRENYVLVGWNTEKDGSGTYYKEGDEIPCGVAHDGEKLYLYAQWEGVPVTVTYKDGVNGEAFEDQVHNAHYGDAVPAFEGEPTRTGYKFGGWDVTEVPETLTEDITFIAKWEICQFNVIYTDGVEDEEIFADQSYTVDFGTETPAFEGTPERTGYAFAGWEPAVAETVGAEDVTYTAKWEAIPVTVTYTDGVEGEEIFADQSYTVVYNSDTPAFEGTPERKGYTFAGWEPAVAEKVGTENVTYTAKWEIIPVTVTYTDGVKGKAFEDQVFTASYGDAVPAFDGTPERKGYKFLGWDVEAPETLTEDIVFTAKWGRVNDSDVPNTGDDNRILRPVVLMGALLLVGAGAAMVVVSKRRKQEN